MVSVSTSQYEFSHGKKPRGTGTWAFFLNTDPTNPVWFYGTYAEAKRQAVARAAQVGAVAMYVGP